MSIESEIGLEIRALAAHYPRRRLSGIELDRWTTDYVSDLIAAGWSASDCRMACAIWRVSDAKKMPSPGELIAKGSGSVKPGSTLPITVPMSLHEDMAEACGEPFAASYLSGATLEGGILTTRTKIARDRLLARPEAMRMLPDHRVLIGDAPPQYSEEHKAEMRAKVAALASQIAAQLAIRGRHDRRAGESEVQQAERLWPSHRVDRVQA